MARQIPYSVVIKESITANGSVEYNFKAPNLQDFKINAIFFVVAGAFDLIRMQDDAGNLYGLMSPSDPIPSAELPQSNTDVKAVNLVTIPLFLAGGRQITFELKDTSGSTNTSSVILEGELTIAN